MLVDGVVHISTSELFVVVVIVVYFIYALYLRFNFVVCLFV